jgi:hypothetical protein
MTILKTIQCNPEFGCEIACAIPYINWLYQHDKLEKVYTVKDMRPFYHFLPDEMIIEHFNERTLDNSVSLKDVPNQWIHHNAKAVTGKEYDELTPEEQRNVNGVLDYSEWTAPEYSTYYSTKMPRLTDKPYVVIFNKFALEHGNMPIGYFDMIMLQQIVEYLTQQGYAVVYRRPSNHDYVQDQNEVNSVHIDLINQYGIKAYNNDNDIIDDKQLMSYYSDCFLLEDLYEKSNIESKNEFELSLYSNAAGFITVNGGNCVLASIFGKPIVVYACEGKEMRDNYFNDNCYFKKFANAPIYPILDPKEDIKKYDTRKYDEVINTIKTVFK